MMGQDGEKPKQHSQEHAGHPVHDESRAWLESIVTCAQPQAIQELPAVQLAVTKHEQPHLSVGCCTAPGV